MAATRYVSLLRFTDQGAHNIKDSASRALSFKQNAEKLEVTVETQLWTVGRYDGLLILSGERQAVIRCLTQLASLGNVRTETMEALNADELKASVG